MVFFCIYILSNVLSFYLCVTCLKQCCCQGSILGPLLFNVFINDIFYFVKKGTLYNYADDNTFTLSYGHPDFNVLTSVLESEPNVLIDWFKVNKM